jgi:DNA-binding beta-propeller fold protein YncE
VAFVLSIDSRTVTPVDLTTGTAGPAIRVGRRADAIVASADGKTVYVANGWSDTLTPISVATERAGRPFRVCDYPGPLAMAPDGKTLYVGCNHTIVPVRTAGNRVGAPMRPVGGGPSELTVAPDGRWLLAADQTQPGSPDWLRVISARTGATVTRVRLQGFPYAVDIAPGGKTAYVPGTGRVKYFPRFSEWLGIVTPLAIASMTAGRPIVVGHDPNMGNESPDQVVFSPDGQTGYAVYPGTDTVVPFRTATGKAARPIHVGVGPLAAVVTPDGKWVYVSEGYNVAAIRTSTGAVTKIKAGPSSLDPLYPGATVIAISPDGKSVYVLNYHSHRGTMTPVNVATNTPGTPIPVGVNPISMVVIP